MANGMRVRLATTLLCTGLALPAMASAQMASAADPAPPTAAQSAQVAVAVTIYNNDLALVRDTRQLGFPRGRGARGPRVP